MHYRKHSLKCSFLQERCSLLRNVNKESGIKEFIHLNSMQGFSIHTPFEEFLEEFFSFLFTMLSIRNIFSFSVFRLNFSRTDLHLLENENESKKKTKSISFIYKKEKES